MIEQISIERFKSIRNSTIQLGRVNVLIGSNGVGKSNLINFFELVHALVIKRLGAYVMEQGNANRILYRGLKESKNLRGLIDFNNTNAFYFLLAPTVENKLYIEETGDFFNSFNLSDKRYKTNWNHTTWDRSVEESSVLHSNRWRAKYLQDFLGSFIVYHFHDTSSTSPMRRECDVHDDRALRHDGANLPAVLYRLQQSDPKAFDLIEAVVHSVAPYFNRFNLKPGSATPDEIRLVWEETGSDMYLDAVSMSDGTLRFVALATLLLQPDLPKTIIIDEPELGLHPAAINKLAGLIRKASVKSQIILSTQSVNLVNCFEPEDIIVVDRDNEQSTFTRLSSDRLSSWLEEYSVGDMWEKNLIGGQP